MFCVFYFFTSVYSFTPEEHRDFLNGAVYRKAKNTYVKKICRSYNCKLMGTGGGYVKGVDHLNFMFMKEANPSEEEALQLIQILVRDVISVYADFPEFAPFVDFPMNSDKFMITLCFRKKGGKFPASDEIYSVTMVQGKLMLRYKEDPYAMKLDFITKECGYKLITVDDLDKPLETWLPPEEDQG